MMDCNHGLLTFSPSTCSSCFKKFEDVKAQQRELDKWISVGTRDLENYNTNEFYKMMSNKDRE